MKLTTAYLVSWSSPSYTMTNSINYKENLFERDNLTPIRDETTFENLHKLQNNIKANTKSVYFNIRGGAHGHLGLVLTNAQYALISLTPFIYLTPPGRLIIPDGTTDHPNSNMRITHTKKVRLFWEVTGVYQSIVQQNVSTVKEAYLANICNWTTN